MGPTSLIIDYCHCDYASRQHSLTTKRLLGFFCSIPFSLTAEASLCLDQSFSSSLDCISSGPQTRQKMVKTSQTSTYSYNLQALHILTRKIICLAVKTGAETYNRHEGILICKMTLTLQQCLHEAPLHCLPSTYKVLDIVPVDVGHGTSEIQRFPLRFSNF